jgi:hypothetical protein
MNNAFSIHHDRSVAIKSALAAILDAQQTAQALTLWQEKYAHQPTFSVQYFARDCCALFGVESERSQLVKSLVHELYVQKLASAKEKPQHGTMAGPQAGAAMVVFQLLFRALLETSDALRTRQITHYVENGLTRMNLDSDTLRSLQRWLSQSKAVIDVNIPQPLMVKLINRTYVGLCECYGPVKADQIMNDAVSKVSTSQSAQLFNPEQLL